MRIAAGVLLIIVAVLDIFGGLFWLGVGGAAKLAGAGTDLTQIAAKEAPKQDPAAAQKTMEAAEQVDALARKFAAYANLLLALGGLNLALVGLGIAAAVVLFMRKAPVFALIVGVLQIVADGTSCALLGHVGVTNILAFLAGLLTIIAAFGYMGASKPPVAATS